MGSKNESHEAAGNPKEACVLAALDLAAARGWDQVTLLDIAQQSGVTLAEMFTHFEDKFDILAALGRKIDREMLERISAPEEGGAPRDALFDILMDRFDVLNDYRAGIVAILQSFKYDPKQAVISLPHLCRSMTWVLESARVNTGGVRGAIRVSALTALYLKVVRVWMRDDTPDMAQTMAALDKELARVEKYATSFGF